MSLSLQWRLPVPFITTRWRGSESGNAALPAASLPRPLTTLVGPIGPPGPAGPPGEDGTDFDLATAEIDGGTFN